MIRVSIAFCALVTSGLAFSSSSAHAEKVTAGPRITIDPGITLPVGNLADGAGFGFGMTGALRFPLNTHIGLSGRTGFVYHLPKNDITALALPLYGGVTYGFKPVVSTPYVAVELGLVHFRQSGDGLPESASTTKLGGTIGGGYRLGFADLRVGLQFYSLGDLGDSISLFSTLSFRIAKF